MIEIDCRENKLIELFKSRGVSYGVSQLDTGDIILKYKDTPRVIIERKTIKDYIHSRINDGRLEDQIKKMNLFCNNNPGVLPIFIIECWKDKQKHCAECKFPEKSFEKSINHLMYYHRFFIYKTNSLKGTYRTIRKIDEIVEEGKITKNVVDIKKHIVPKDYSPFYRMLTTINGVSKNTVDAIAVEYSNIPNLLAGFNESENPELLLAGLKLKSGRKIGPKLSKKIYDAIVNNVGG